MYDGLNVGKLNVALNLKKPESVALVKRLVTEWCDAVAENYAPKAMKGFGLDYDTLAAIKPDLVMISACLNGQTGPHKDYPGFGGQGARSAGTTRSPAGPTASRSGPYGTITDSLAPRYVAAALAAGLLYRRRTGKGVYLDISQVESANWSLSPWLLDYEVGGVIRLRDGNRHAHASPHGAFRCLDEGDVDDRWVAIACWTDEQWTTLAALIGLAETPGSRRWSSARRAKTRSKRASPRSPRPAPRRRSARAAGARASRPFRWKTSAICTTIRSSRYETTSYRTRTRFSGPGCTSATASGCRMRRAATSRPGRRSARTTTGCCVTSSVAATATSRP